MNGHFLKLYVAPNTKHHSKLLYEWVLEEAKALGIPGGVCGPCRGRLRPAWTAA